MAGFQPKTYLCRLMSLMPLFNAAQEVVASICLYLRQQYRKCHWPSSQRLVDLSEGQKSPAGTKNSNWTTAGINVVDLTYHSKVSVHPLSLHRRSTRTTIWRRKQSMQDQIIIMKAQNGNLHIWSAHICSITLKTRKQNGTGTHVLLLTLLPGDRCQMREGLFGLFACARVCGFFQRHILPTRQTYMINSGSFIWQRVKTLVPWCTQKSW